MLWAAGSSQAGSWLEATGSGSVNCRTLDESLTVKEGVGGRGR